MRAILIVALLVVAAPNREDPTPKEIRKTPQELILGDWLYVGNGKEPPNTIPADPMFTFRILPEETIWIVRGTPSPGNGLSAKITLDWTKSPVAIDFLQRNGGTSLRGIVKVEGDRLTLAWAGSDNRPQDFTNTGSSIHHFIRVKK